MTGSRRVLYIDDDAALARLVTRDLRRHDYEVVTAPSGAEGVRLAAEGGFDVICLDHYMPGQDGLETIALLRALPELPPIVYVTGSEEGRVAVAALRAGAADYVIKEVGEEFLVLLRSAMAGAVEREELRRHKEEAQREMRLARDRAEDLAAQRELLLREVNHRVANSLQLIASLTQLQLSTLTDPAARSALVEVRARVFAVAQVHRRLYTSEDVRKVALGDYLATLIEELERSLALTSGRIELQATPLAVATDKAVSLGVIAAELVTNAFKYAYAAGVEGPIRVVLERQTADGMLLVEDEGVGLPGNGVLAPGGTGLGRRIVEALANGMGGRAEYIRKARGTGVAVHFPVEA
jgi:two-component sensor histidine kinase